MREDAPVYVRGAGAISPAGSGLFALRSALHGHCKTAIANELISSPTGEPFSIRRVPRQDPRPACLNHPRLRRSAKISQFAAIASLEALGGLLPARSNTGRWTVIACVMAGCVEYSRRFYEEVLRDPSTASPLLFPETVFNAPASHVASILGVTGPVDTLVGAESVFLSGLELAQERILTGECDDALVLASEEADWISSYAAKLFSRKVVLAEGAAAIWLSNRPSESGVGCWISDIASDFTPSHREVLSASSTTLWDGCAGWPANSTDESAFWARWTGNRFSPKHVLGEGLSVSAGWHSVLAACMLEPVSGACAAVSASAGKGKVAVAQFRI